jgi:succinate-semialdehyde dehydrogenase / glutarate-semialdehyde dehydrogenase
MNADVRDERARLALKRPDLLREAAFIGGRWRTADAATVVVNPATGRPLGTVPSLGREDVEEAVAAAHAAFSDWRRHSGKERGAILRRWYELMLAHEDDLARLMTAEQGKPVKEAKGEIAYAASFIEWFGEEAKRTYGDVIPGHLRDRRITVFKEPVGVVAAITPWNFPAAMITRKVGPALAAGCTAVLKPSGTTPFSALALALLAEEAGVPAGVFNVVTGKAKMVGDVLTGDPRIRKFSFTGSTDVGKALAARCMETVKRVSLELGGNAPFIVFDDAHVDAAVEEAIAAKFRNTGQTCVCANRFLVQDGIYDAFAERLAARVAKFVVGDGLAGVTDQGPLIDEGAVAKVAEHVEDARKGGAQVLTGGKPLHGQFYAPTVLSGVKPGALLCHEETFGPVAGLVRFSTEAEAIALANDTSAGLAAYFFTRDLDRSWRVGEALEYGMVGLNTGMVSTEVAPFGGCKESGIGREGSYYGIDEYLEPKMICTRVAAAP